MIVIKLNDFLDESVINTIDATMQGGKLSFCPGFLKTAASSAVGASGENGSVAAVAA